jgi:hypothetical protein
MGSIVLKMHPDLDEYVMWSTNCDSPVSTVGDRESLVAYLIEYYDDSPGEAEERVARADRTGTSRMMRGWGRWNCSGFIVYEAMGEHAPRWLPRANLAAFCYADDNDNMRNKLALTEAVED